MKERVSTPPVEKGVTILFALCSLTQEVISAIPPIQSRRTAPVPLVDIISRREHPPTVTCRNQCSAPPPSFSVLLSDLD